ncbi:MAG: hypothetical protein ACR2OA_12290 [Rubripirellula sp.]
MAQKSDAHSLGMMDTDTEITVNVRDELIDEYHPWIINALNQDPAGKVAGVDLRLI